MSISIILIYSVLLEKCFSVLIFTFGYIYTRRSERRRWSKINRAIWANSAKFFRELTLNYCCGICPAIKKKGRDKEMKLYEISAEFEELLTDDELTDEELQEKLQNLEMAVEDKCQNAIGLLRTLANRSNAYDAEQKRLAALKKSTDNRIAQVKAYYLDELSRIGMKRVQTSLGVMSIAKAGGKRSLEVDDETLIPKEYFDNVPTLNRDRLRENLENDEVIPGAHLKERGTYLRIS